MLIMLQGGEMNAVILIGRLLFFAIGIAIFSLLNGVFLCFAAKIVFKQAPELPATFGYSAVAALAFSLAKFAMPTSYVLNVRGAGESDPGSSVF